MPFLPSQNWKVAAQSCSALGSKENLKMRFQVYHPELGKWEQLDVLTFAYLADL